MPKVFDPSLATASDKLASITLTGENARHIAKSLRMSVGENLSVCDGAGRDFGCEITSVTGDSVELKVQFVTPSESEAKTYITVYQGVPKGDKFSDVIQKCTEVGASKFVPVLMSRSVSRPDPKSAHKKVERWQKVAHSAAEQSRRGIIPAVTEITDFKVAVEQCEGVATILFYEGGGKPLKEVLTSLKDTGRVNIFIGPEGGFDPEEVEALEQIGAKTTTLGERILRTETAPVVACANILYELG